jgi:hypothetical protein
MGYLLVAAMLVVGPANVNPPSFCSVDAVRPRDSRLTAQRGPSRFKKARTMCGTKCGRHVRRLTKKRRILMILA